MGTVLSRAQRDHREEDSDSDYDFNDYDHEGCDSDESDMDSVGTTMPTYTREHSGSAAVTYSRAISHPNFSGIPNVSAYVGPSPSEHEETIFVNAANSPNGPRARDKRTGSVPFGGHGFQPVIVDLSE